MKTVLGWFAVLVIAVPLALLIGRFQRWYLGPLDRWFVNSRLGDWIGDLLFPLFLSRDDRQRYALIRQRLAIQRTDPEGARLLFEQEMQLMKGRDEALRAKVPHDRKAARRFHRESVNALRSFERDIAQRAGHSETPEIAATRAEVKRRFLKDIEWAARFLHRS